MIRGPTAVQVIVWGADGDAQATRSAADAVSTVGSPVIMIT